MRDGTRGSRCWADGAGTAQARFTALAAACPDAAHPLASGEIIHSRLRPRISGAICLTAYPAVCFVAGRNSASKAYLEETGSSPFGHSARRMRSAGSFCLVLFDLRSVFIGCATVIFAVGPSLSGCSRITCSEAYRASYRCRLCRY